MILTETTPIPAASLPLDLLREHLRLGTGFASDGEQDALLEACLRAAIAAVEGRTGLALIERGFVWSLSAWRDAQCEPLPLRPVRTITEVRQIARDGTATPVPAASWSLLQDAQRPALRAAGAALPTIPPLGSVEIAFDAGFGADWSAVPPDVGRATLLIAADFYDRRDGATSGALPGAALALLERHRVIRLGGSR